MKIIIIGAGIIGTSLAWEAMKRGADVTLLDAGDRVSGTSGTSFAWVNAHGKPPLQYQRLNDAAIDAHQRLQAEFPASRWLHLTGSAEFRQPTETDTLQAEAARLEASGYSVSWLDTPSLLLREPALDTDTLPQTPVLWCEREGWLDTRLYIHTLLDALIARGGEVRTSTPVATIERRGNRVTGVTLANGERLEADIVVNCSGRWADSAPFQPDLAVPLAPSAGLLLRVPKTAAPVRHVLITSAFDVRPDGPNHSLICPNDLVVPWSLAESPAERDSAAKALLAQAAHLLPGLRGLTEYQVILGIRALPRDGLPAAGSLPGIEGYAVLVTHSGVTLAALLASLMAEELVAEKTSPTLEPYRPARLLG